jgi:hypothetical protein
VLFEPGRNGSRALDCAVVLSRELQAELTVVATAPQAPPSCCAGSAVAFNGAVREAVADDLCHAADQIAGLQVDARFELLVEGRDPPLEQFLAERGVELVLLPARHSMPGTRRHPAARRLRRLPGCEVRLVNA